MFFSFPPFTRDWKMNIRIYFRFNEYDLDELLKVSSPRALLEGFRLTCTIKEWTCSMGYSKANLEGRDSYYGMSLYSGL